jgi:hypothetical protein
MKLNIDALMILLLIIFAASFATMIIYGEAWRIRLSTTDAKFGSVDRERAKNAFIMSCISIMSGAAMLYIFGTRFMQDEKKEQPHSEPKGRPNLVEKAIQEQRRLEP